ncbi:unnamed protein product, partial [marine sediment metagenome]
AEYNRIDCVTCRALVPKTGQTTSYDGTRDGEDGDIKAGVEWPNPRFTVNDGTVTDNLTGLIWLKDANCIATNYTGFDSDGQVTWQQALDFVDGINDGTTYPLCGAGSTDWRLPNVRELHSLIHYGYRDLAVPDTSGTNKWSEDDPFNNVKSDYWSSSTYTDFTGNAWRVNMYGGSVYTYTKSNDYCVWPVRGGQ